MALWTAGKVLLIGAATIVLAVILGFVCGIAIPLLGGPPVVAIAGAVFCYAWGAMIGGGQFATRCRIVGLISLLIAAGLARSRQAAKIELSFEAAMSSTPSTTEALHFGPASSNFRCGSIHRFA